MSAGSSTTSTSPGGGVVVTSWKRPVMCRIQRHPIPATRWWSRSPCVRPWPDSLRASAPCWCFVYFEDLTESQTAEILGISIGTVNSQARDGIARLRLLAPELNQWVDNEVRA